MCTYKTYFKLTNDVCDIDAVNEYLHDDNWEKYLDNGKLKEKIISIVWTLTGTNIGYVEVKSSEELTYEESREISHFINAQNSDSLGEGFEQEPFANYNPNRVGIGYSYHNTGFERHGSDDWEDETDEDWVRCKFDWQTNEYEL